MSTPFRVVFVCTGNICRSPAAERLLGAYVPPGSGVTVESLGTAAMVGEPISPPMASLLAAAGANPSSFAARLATRALLANADLVVGLSREHRAAAVSLQPRLVRSAFTLRELSRLASRIPVEISAGDSLEVRLRTLTGAAAQTRHPAPTEPDDIEDPYRRGAAAYERSFAAIRESIDAIAGVLHLP